MMSTALVLSVLCALSISAATALKIDVVSAGWADGNMARISVDNEVIVEGFGQSSIAGGGGIGINYVILASNGAVKKAGSYNTYGGQYAAGLFVKMLDSVCQDGDFLAIAVGDEASNCIMDDKVSVWLADLGARLSYDHFMYKTDDGQYKPFKCGRHGGGSQNAASGWWLEDPNKNPNAAHRNSYGLILQVGGEVLAEKGTRQGKGKVEISGSFSPVTTTATTTTTTTNTVLQALHDRLDELEGQARDKDNELVEKLTSSVLQLEEKLQKEVQDRKDLEAARKDAEAASTKMFNERLAAESDARAAAEIRVSSLESTIADMMNSRMMALDVPDTDGKDSRCGNGACAVPSIEADGETLMLMASKVQFMSNSCGTTDLCELQRNLMAVMEKMAQKPE